MQMHDKRHIERCIHPDQSQQQGKYSDMKAKHDTFIDCSGWRLALIKV